MKVRIRKTGIFVKGNKTDPMCERVTIGDDFVYMTSKPLKTPVFIPAGKAKRLTGRNKKIADMIKKLWKL